MSNLQAQFPGSQDAMNALAHVVQVYRQEIARDENGMELEMRFGHASTGHVTTGVPAEMIDRLITFVQTNPDIRMTEWAEVQDVFFDINGEERRSRTTYDTDTLRVKTQVIRKQRLAECLLRCDEVYVRVVVSRETPDMCEEIGVKVVSPKHVRIQQRRSAHLASHDFGPDATWTIDFGLVWSGDSKVDVEQRQMACEAPQYTFEMELTDPQYVVKNDDMYVACSLGLKAADFMATTAYFQLVSTKMHVPSSTVTESKNRPTTRQMCTRRRGNFFLSHA